MPYQPALSDLPTLHRLVTHARSPAAAWALRRRLAQRAARALAAYATEETAAAEGNGEDPLLRGASGPLVRPETISLGPLSRPIRSAYAFSTDALASQSEASI